MPVKFDRDIYYKANNDKITLPISTLTYLFFYKTEKKKIHLEVITSLPSFDEQDTTFQKFKGTVLVKNWKGKFVTGFIFKNGKTYKINKEGTKNISSKSEKTELADLVCTTTDWYTWRR